MHLLKKKKRQKKKNHTNKQTHKLREQICGCQGLGGVREMDQEFGVS